MKNHFRRLIALALVLCLLVPAALPASAAGWNSTGSSNSSGWGRLFTWIWEELIDTTPEPEETQPTPETEPEAPTAAPSGDPGMTLALVEDQDTVSDAVVMRASVYAADESDPVAQAELDGSNVVYYSSTLIDYDGPTSSPWNGQSGTINQTMADLEVEYAYDHQLDTSNLTWMGLYFGMYNRNVSRTGKYVPVDADYSATSVSCSTAYNNRNSTTYYALAADGKYYPVSISRSGYTSSTRRYTISYVDGNGSTQYVVNNESNITVTLYTAPSISATSSKYAGWVKWGGNDEAEQGGYIHSGMVTGLVDGVPQFNGSYASRLFDNSELAGKHVYTDVGLPFVYDQTTGYYTFDSGERGAYFLDGEIKSGEKLELMTAPVVVQRYSPQEYRTAFMPFNVPSSNTVSNYYNTEGKVPENGKAYTLSGTSNFFYSMITSVPFTMTANGRMTPSDDTSAPIAFQFSGDDDVWVFIDDVLVLDLGGIHDAVSGEINFATNEVTFWTTEASVPTGDATAETEGGFGVAGVGEKLTQGYIFNDGDIQGKLNTTRSTFAATDNHTLTIVYVERGANLSNCKISFNLPQKDYIAVSKNIDGNLYKNTDETTVVDQITDELFATLNQRNFSYILYENGEAMTAVRFSRYDANGNFVGNGSTASDGTFTVKNGETVRFYDVDFNGQNEYYVAELDPDAGSNNNAWGAASWAHTINTAYGDSASVTDTAAAAGCYVSKTIKTQGSSEAVDVIYFTNTNKLLSPVADIANDEYVIDFGLAVELNPLANDTYSATNDTLTLAGISDAADGTFSSSVTGKYGTLEIRNGKVVYTLNKQFTGVEVFYYQVGLSFGADDLEGTVGTITIMPASTMYYEESFTGLNLTGTWTDMGSAQGGYQEEGRVGNTADSPYGSDVLYMNNTGDSYGTSKYVNTAGAAATFSYTFTGTGTALYARISDQTAYMMITVTDAQGNEVYTWNRNTIYKPVEDTQLTDNTLYNIPVFAYTAENYGTYTVTVSLSKAILVNGSYYRGCDFYLDGIRVYNPANAYTGESADSVLIEDAYRHDGEAYITVDSLRNKLLLDSTKFVPAVDEEGNPIVDEFGDPVYDIAWDGVNYVVFTDSNGEIKDAQTYQSAGPKEEVYMKAGQSVTFSLENWDQNRNKIFLGIKAPSGSGTVIINGVEITINNTTDIYYEITKYAEVSNNVATFKITAGSALISVTTIKVTGTADFTIVSGGPSMPEEIVPGDGE